MTILLMVVVATTSHATAKAEAEEKHRQEQELRYEIYDDMDDKEEEEDEEDEEQVPAAGYIDVAEFEAAKGLVSLTTMPEAKTSEAVDTLPRSQEEISAARDKALQQLREVERASTTISVKDRVRAIDLSGVVQDLSGAFADAPLVPRVGLTADK